MIPYPPRFRTIEDALLYEQCLRDRKEFPENRQLYPMKLLPNGNAIPNPEYENAPFEMGYFAHRSLEK